MNVPMRWKLISYTAALFAAGAICGAMMLPRTPPKPETLKVDCREEIAKKLRNKLKCQLNLTDAQLEKMEPLIQKASGDVEASHLDCLNRISAALDCLHSQICTDLTPDQKQKLAALEAARCQELKVKYNYQPGTSQTNNR